MNQRLNHKALVLKHIFPDVVKDVDGYYIWFPKGNGGWTANDLAVVVQLLNEANRLWDDQVKTFFSHSQIGNHP